MRILWPSANMTILRRVEKKTCEKMAMKRIIKFRILRFRNSKLSWIRAVFILCVIDYLFLDSTICLSPFTLFELNI